MTPALAHVGEEVRLAREAAGMTQEQLAHKINASRSLLAMVETGQRVPHRDLTAALDNALGTDGRFDRMRSRLVVPESRPEWFRPWVSYEENADEIRWFEPLLVPGLLQTEAYARALLTRPGDPNRTESLVASRLERQAVLGRVVITVIIDEAVLHRRIGGQAVMAAQLDRLATTEDAAILVLPAAADTCLGTMGQFLLATVDGTEVAYVETPARGFVLADSEVVSDVRQRWEGLLTETLPRGQSRSLIAEAAKQWKV